MYPEKQNQLNGAGDETDTNQAEGLGMRDMLAWGPPLVADQVADGPPMLPPLLDCDPFGPVWVAVP